MLFEVETVELLNIGHFGTLSIFKRFFLCRDVVLYSEIQNTYENRKTQLSGTLRSVLCCKVY